MQGEMQQHIVVLPPPPPPQTVLVLAGLAAKTKLTRRGLYGEDFQSGINLFDRKVILETSSLPSLFLLRASPPRHLVCEG